MLETVGLGQLSQDRVDTRLLDVEGNNKLSFKCFAIYLLSFFCSIFRYGLQCFGSSEIELSTEEKEMVENLKQEAVEALEEEIRKLAKVKLESIAAEIVKSLVSKERVEMIGRSDSVEKVATTMVSLALSAAEKLKGEEKIKKIKIKLSQKESIEEERIKSTTKVERERAKIILAKTKAMSEAIEKIELAIEEISEKKVKVGVVGGLARALSEEKKLEIGPEESLVEEEQPLLEIQDLKTILVAEKEVMVLALLTAALAKKNLESEEMNLAAEMVSEVAIATGKRLAKTVEVVSRKEVIGTETEERAFVEIEELEMILAEEITEILKEIETKKIISNNLHILTEELKERAIKSDKLKEANITLSKLAGEAVQRARAEKMVL